MAKAKKKIRAANGSKSMSTRAIHAGEPRKRYADSLMTPIIQTSTFTFKNTKAIEDYTKKGKEQKNDSPTSKAPKTASSSLPE